MMAPLRPPLIKPARFMFDSDAAFDLAMKNYAREMKRRRDEDDWNDAVMVVFVTVILGGMALAVLAALTLGFGWRGPAYLLAGAGLFWVAVVQVHKHISKPGDSAQ